MALWVFGYGSLLWNPGFQPVEKRLAVLKDYHRSFCMLSIHHRGSVEEPGLVLALDAQEGAQCTGLALRVAEDEEEPVMTMLRERELISSAYVEETVTLRDRDGTDLTSVAYVIDPHHEQYVHFELERQAQIMARAVGGRGPNVEYLNATADMLHSLGIRDVDIEWLVTRVAEIRASEM